MILISFSGYAGGEEEKRDSGSRRRLTIPPNDQRERPPGIKFVCRVYTQRIQAADYEQDDDDDTHGRGGEGKGKESEARHEGKRERLAMQTIWRMVIIKHRQ